MKYIYFLIVIMFSCSGFSVVDMKNANFSKTWTDFELKTGNFNLSIVRTYNSRSLYNGMFGFGWCSRYETTLEVAPEGVIRVKECGGGADYVYYPKGFQSQSTEKAVNSILKKVKAKNSTLSQKQISELKKELLMSSFLRSKMAKKLGLLGRAKKDQKYHLKGNNSEFIVLRSGKYLRRLSDGTYQIFNKKGFLVGLMDQKRNKIIVKRSGSKIVKISDSKQNQLVFRYLPKNKGLSITVPGRDKLVYSFKGEDLECVRDSKKGSTCYKYDSLHNLVKITYPNKATEVLTYDKDKDWVLSFKDQRNCLEKYTYGADSKNPLDHYWSDVVKTCNKKVVHKSRYAFKFKKNKSNQRYLNSVKFIKNGKSTLVVYHPAHSRPVLVKRGKNKKTYTYNKNGMIVKVASKKTNYKYSYDPKCNKVTSVKVANQGRKLSSSTSPGTTYFKYKQCQLVSVKDSHGRFFNFKKDNRDRIVEASDDKGKKVTVKYDPVFGEPNLLKLNSAGIVKFRYSSNGKRHKVKPFNSKTFYSIISMINDVYNVIRLSEVRVDVNI